VTDLSAVAFGVVLAACAGLRAFLPVFSASAAVQLLELEVPRYLAWLDRPETLVLFGVATAIEIIGDKIPFVDHVLDSVQVITKPALAALAATPFIHQLAPEHAVAIAIIIGAPLALGVHATKASVRVGSSATTGGIGNPILSMLEDILAFAAIAIAFVAPLLALAVLALLLFLLVRFARAIVRRFRTPSSSRASA